MVFQSTRRLLIVTLMACVVPLSQSAADQLSTYTSIVVNDMHCSACAKKIAAKLYVLPGVLEVRADVSADTAYVVPQKQNRLSPRALWEAVESAGFKVIKLAGPSGVFTSKPNR